MKIEIDLYDLPNENIEAIFEHVHSRLKAKPSTEGVIIFSEWGGLDKEITFAEMVQNVAAFWGKSDPAWMAHNLGIMKSNLCRAAGLISEIISRPGPGTLPEPGK